MARLNEEKTRRQETAKNSKKRKNQQNLRENGCQPGMHIEKREKQTLQMSEAVKAICVDGGEG